MFTAERELDRLRAREQRLGRLLASLADDYDACLIDCPPGTLRLRHAPGVSRASGGDLAGQGRTVPHMSNTRSSTGVGLAVEPTSSWPSPAQDYYDGPLDLNRVLVASPASTFPVRVAGNGLRRSGVLDGDVLLVDRAVRPAPGRLAVVVIDGEHRVGRLATHSGVAALRTDDGVVLLPAGVVVWGVVTVVIRQLGRGAR